MRMNIRTAAARVAACRLRTARAASAGLEPLVAAQSPAEGRRLALLARDWHARLRPSDAVERATTDLVVGAHWRRLLLDRIEIRLLAALADGRPTEGLPSLGVIGRARGRAERDLGAALSDQRQLAREPGVEAPHLNAARLAWLAERAAAQEALVASVCGRPFVPPAPEAEPEPEWAPPAAAAAAAHAPPEPAAA
jgi:hypothetical protein